MILVAFPYTTRSPLVGLAFAAQSAETSWEYIQFHRVSLCLHCIGELAFS